MTSVSLCHRLIIVFLTLALLESADNHAQAKSPQRRLAVISAPGDLLDFPPQGSERGKFAPYPIHPNNLPEYLPGNLYDVRGLFKSYGAKFGADDFALYNPKCQIVVVGASPTTTKLVDTFLLTGAEPITNLLLEGDITIGKKSTRSARQIHWQSYGKSGVRSKSSASGNASGVGYSLDIDPVAMADGTTFDCSMILKATHGKVEYGLTTQLAIPSGRRQTILLGTTPEGERVEFHLTIKRSSLVDNPPPEYSKWKEDLLKRLRETDTP